MLTSSEKKDYILRMIEQIRQMMQAMLGKLREGESPDTLLAEARDAVATLLGPLAAVAPRMDSVTAGQMVGDPDVLEAWATVTAGEAQVLAARGDAAGAQAAQQRALELALEAHLRTPADRPELVSLVRSLLPGVERARLGERHREASSAFDQPAGSGR